MKRAPRSRQRHDLYAKYHDYDSEISDLLGECGVMSLGSVEAIKEMVSVGLGCAVLPSMAVRNEKKGRGLIVRSLSPKLHRELAVVVRRDKRLDLGLRNTLSALKAIV